MSGQWPPGVQEEVEDIVRQTLRRLAPRYTTKWEDMQDLESAALLGGWRAVQTYEPRRGVAWGTWLISCVRYAIAEERRQQDHLTRALRAELRRCEKDGCDAPRYLLPSLSLEALLNEHVVNEFETAIRVEETLGDSTPDPADEALTRIDAARVAAAVAALPEGEREIIRRWYWDELTAPQIGRRMGRSASRVSQRRRRAEAKLRTMLEEALP